MSLVWKSNALYLHGTFYLGKIVKTFSEDTCMAIIQTIPTGVSIGTFADEREARKALLAKVQSHLEATQDVIGDQP